MPQSTSPKRHLGKDEWKSPLKGPNSSLGAQLLLRSLDIERTKSQKGDTIIAHWGQCIEKTRQLPSIQVAEHLTYRAFAYDSERQYLIIGARVTLRGSSASMFVNSQPNNNVLGLTAISELSNSSHVAAIAASKWPQGFAFAVNGDPKGNAGFCSYDHKQMLMVELGSHKPDNPPRGRDQALSCAMDPGGSRFAIGTEKAVYVLRIPETGDFNARFSEYEQDEVLGGERVDAFGLGYLSPHNLISGWRSGFIKHWDTRTSGKRCSRSDAFQDPGSGCLNLKVLDENRFVTICLGVPSKIPLDPMRVYDIRYGRKRERYGNHWTEPVVQCPQWTCGQVRPVLPLAAHGRMNIIAAENPLGLVSIFNAQTGERIPSVLEEQG